MSGSDDFNAWWVSEFGAPPDLHAAPLSQPEVFRLTRLAWNQSRTALAAEMNEILATARHGVAHPGRPLIASAKRPERREPSDG